MRSIDASLSTRLKVGVFTSLGFIGLVILSIFVNHRPYWWKPCHLVEVHVEDATGIKARSGVRSLGVEIGYLNSVALTGEKVLLGICITAPVDILPTTRALIRGEGFLGDKFIELKPLKYRERSLQEGFWKSLKRKISKGIGISEAWAEEESLSTPAKKTEVIPVTKEGVEQDFQKLVQRMDSIMQQTSHLVEKVNQSVYPEEIRATLRQLNKTLESIGYTVSPQGNLNQAIQKNLSQLENTIDQLREIVTRVNQGKGSVGMLLNDPSYAEEFRELIRNLNRLVSRVSGLRFVVDIGAASLGLAKVGRGWGQLGLWPSSERYYLVGVASDGRGVRSVTTTTLQSNGTTQISVEEKISTSRLVMTAMVGKLFLNRKLDLSLGALYGDGAVSAAWRLGPSFFEDRIQLRTDLYVHSAQVGIDSRLTFMAQPIPSLFLRVGIESARSPSISYGANLVFDDEDIKFLFALK